MLPKYGTIPKLLLSSLTCSQIWLSPLVDESQPTYLTNLNKTTLDMVHCSTGQPGSADGKRLIHLKANGFQKK
jgi:hypothetical protein